MATTDDDEEQLRSDARKAILQAIVRDASNCTPGALRELATALSLIEGVTPPGPPQIH